MKDITYEYAAQQALLKHRNQAKFITGKIKAYADHGIGNVKMLVNRNDQKRLRAGDYRILFIEDDKVIKIQDIGHRSDI